MRIYRLKSGLRETLLEIFETKSIPEHRRLGMSISKPFRSLEDENAFFFMRGFPDEESRRTLKSSFYQGSLWKEQLEDTLMPLIDSYDSIVIDGGDALSVHED